MRKRDLAQFFIWRVGHVFLQLKGNKGCDFWSRKRQRIKRADALEPAGQRAIGA
ncbi:hypothetical protein NBRC111894_2281 [Sporolactobacillus inulinus]|uniref:Uncharacterized protein n=1 Tax=Sporolactobacillus inulinus TaxID=2078 RepID=A0A4Y1ZCC9_9BACL|nr:hypothetical protein NBRC111894_2281 [Sporolactobacillus inulinus]